MEVRMSSLSKLQQLAIRSLLKDEVLVISALKNLHMELFPPLFKGAFDSQKTNILTAMVAAWPFRCLPVGALMKTPDLETLKAVLGGLDLLIKEKDRPRSCKLEVLDLRDARHDFWNAWAGLEDGVCSTDAINEKQPVVDHPLKQEKQVVTVIMNLSLNSRYLCKYLTYFCRWAIQRKEVLQVICEKLEFGTIPAYNPVRLLEVFEPRSVLKLVVKGHWNIRTLAMFAPGLGQMRNIQKLHLNNICMPLESIRNREMNVWCIRKIIPQFSHLVKLQHLYLNGVYFLNERVEQVLRSLESPLETLAITCCMLSEEDMMYLSQCPSIDQLTHLDLSGVSFVDLIHPLLRRLLEKLTATLQTLKLKDCTLKDFQISVLLPPLSQCSQLVELNFARNFLSLSTLKKLLQHTASLRQLTRETYPAPEEVYDGIGNVLPDRFAQYCSELLETLRGIREPKEVSFVSRRCLHCWKFFSMTWKPHSVPVGNKGETTVGL